MSTERGLGRVAPTTRPWRPLWWWFVVQGALVGAWGLFALVSPVRGREGWLLDGAAFGIMLVLAGTVLVVQGIVSRRYGRGWFGVLAGGVLAIVCGVACFTSVGLGSADALFWVVTAFYVIEGLVFIAGTSGGVVLRNWGVLMGGIVYLALVLLLVLRFTIDRDFEIIDPVWGSMGLLYGIAMIAAAMLTRHNAIAQGGRDA